MTGEFSFAAHAATFEEHLHASIPGLDDLRTILVGLSRSFVQPETTALDIGCSTGTLMRLIRDANADRSGVRYVGIDAEPCFRQHWHDSPDDMRFYVCDARSFDGIRNMSLVCSVFTLQFIPERHRVELLRRVHGGLIEGGALLIAEKVLAESAAMQDVLTFDYYDHKRQHFSSDEILDKERSLRGLMTCWRESQIVHALLTAGFGAAEIHRVWQNRIFVGLVAVRRAAEMR